jgi:prolyl 4-hydroxylase
MKYKKQNKYLLTFFISGFFILSLIILLYFYINKYEFFSNDFKIDELKYSNDFDDGNDYIITKYHNFLSKEECDAIIDFCKKKGMENSKVYSQKDNGSSLINLKDRISEQLWLNDSNTNEDLKIQKIINKIHTLNESITKIPKINQESLQIVKYNKGGFYKEHYDACSYDAEMCKNMNKNSGQRITTLLIYLNDNFEGGETKFTHEKVNLSVKPEKGMAVLFYNVSNKDDNIVHPLSIHTGTELLSGEKWICNVWSHKNKF